MTDQHRANPADWLLHAASLDDADSSCILELRARIEALEAAQLEQAESNRFCTDAIVRRVEALEATHEATAMAELRAAERELAEEAAPMTELRAASAEARPAGLVERVRQIIGLDPVGDGKARAAICEVAKWLREQGTPASGWAMRLEQEADRG
jgi:hypothetical protein